jgi:hypothetical protein
MTLQLLHSEFPDILYEEFFSSSFYQCTVPLRFFGQKISEKLAR